MKRTVILFTSFAMASAAIQCWSGQQTYPAGKRTVPSNMQPFSSALCNDADFCYDSYVKRNHDGDDSYTVTKSCGEPGKCFETGCHGPGDEKICCCAGDLCNSSNGIKLSFAGILIILSFDRPFYGRVGPQSIPKNKNFCHRSVRSAVLADRDANTNHQFTIWPVANSL
ncbi:unnamed protein product [Caenorhabditis auriculariae]|uniref:Uncharacterized protein n=1 Tax=Caenorhabditis auriculariae TaxID=2777116 RepID=A0A8S1HEE4_9PELO|nr:unnamed protein product [Caenorhabditis auriculariae]